MNKYDILLEDAKAMETSLWTMGEHLVTVCDLAKTTPYESIRMAELEKASAYLVDHGYDKFTPAYLDDIAKTVMTFKPEERVPNVSFTAHNLAIREHGATHENFKVAVAQVKKAGKTPSVRNVVNAVREQLGKSPIPVGTGKASEELPEPQMSWLSERMAAAHQVAAIVEAEEEAMKERTRSLGQTSIDALSEIWLGNMNGSRRINNTVRAFDVSKRSHLSAVGE